MAKNPFHYNAEEITFKRARRLRKRMTASEKLLWKALRRNQLEGYYFRRQHPIWFYIADFYCHEAKLVIELDGESHNSVEAQEYDENRDAVFENMDITVLRFRNEDVFSDLGGVLEKITQQLHITCDVSS